jgi:endoglucanase
VAVPLFCSSVLHGQQSVDFQVTAEWQGGYNADIVLEVGQKGPGLNGWDLSWLGNPEVEGAWNCVFSMDGDRTVLGHVDYNQNVQPGDSVTLGLTGIGSWPPSPMDVRINGMLVDVMIDGGDGGDGGGGGDGGDDEGGHDGGDGHDGGGADGCCFGDLDGDRMVNGGDLATLLAAWNSSDAMSDLDQSGLVDGADLAQLLGRWGSCDTHGGGSHDHGDHMDITMWGDFHDSNDNSHHAQMVGGRTPITTEAMMTYNDLRAFLGLASATQEEVGQWAFAEALTNNTDAWGGDVMGVGLYYAMQGAKVGWITDDGYDSQIIADIQRTARTVCNPIEMEGLVMDMVRQFGHAGYAEHLEANGMVQTFINTLKMEPHYGGWMHGRCHGFRSIEGVAINHDVNHLTVLSWDQMQPFMNDTFDWPQWPALDVSDSGVIEYFQSMVVLGDPVGQNM